MLLEIVWRTVVGIHAIICYSAPSAQRAAHGILEPFLLHRSKSISQLKNFSIQFSEIGIANTLCNCMSAACKRAV